MNIIMKNYLKLLFLIVTFCSLESYKLINLLLEEIIQCEDHLTLENYLGDLANFEADLIVGNDKINELLRKIDSFLLKCISKDEFLTNNIINILTKMTSSSNIQTKILIELILIYSNFMLKSCEKFYKIKFDISRYYNMSVNFECLNNMISKLHNENISLKKVEYTKVKQIVDNYFSLLIYNYDEKQQINNIPFGISTNYMLILLFCLDNDLVNLKILFRNCHTRTLIISILHRFKFLIFVDYKRSLSLFSEKSSFLWKHTSVLEQIYPSYKISKKFFYYAWYHIQINFVGLIVRYKKCREIFYNLYENIDIKLCCWKHFDNILEFFFISQSKGETNVLKEFEEYQKENLFYLIKEVCCDFILYCNNRECLEIKKSKILSYYHNTENNKYFKYFFEDLIEAFKENVYCDKNWDIGKKISI